MKRNGYILLLLLLLVAACDSMGPEEPMGEECQFSSPGVFFPFSNDNRWELLYYNTLLDPDQPSDTLRVEYKEVDVVLGGEPTTAYARRIYTGGSQPTSDLHRLFQNGSEGLFEVGLMTPEDTILTRYLTNPYPAETGRISYAAIYGLDRDTLYLADSTEIKLVAVDEEFETPAGTFRTYVYRHYTMPPDGIASGRFHFIYYAPGVGIVGQIVRRETFQGQPGEVRARILLHDYCLKE